MHLKLGNVREFCEIMIQLQNWEKAMIFAPGESLSYWKDVAMRYSQATNDEVLKSELLIISGEESLALQNML